MKSIHLLVSGLLIVLSSLLGACSAETDRLEAALRFAGSNRPELEKVLEHYSASSADKLKYKAAVYLIENMPDHYSYQSAELDTFRTYVRDFGMRNEYVVIDNTIRVMLAETFPDRYTAIPSLDNATTVFDSHVITSSFLIDNIEQAFEAWQAAPWGKEVSFETFCREILPYRAGNEPLEDWRSAYREHYRSLLDSMKAKDNVVEAGRLLYDSIYNQRWIFDNTLTNDYMGAKTLFDSRVGDCRLMAHYAVYACRSLGIPSGIDCILQNPDMMFRQHYWNYIKDAGGSSIPFELYGTPPASPIPNKIPRKMGKVYRIYFDTPTTPLSAFREKGLLPSPLDNPHLEEVSDRYFDGASVTVKTQDSVLYLGVFNNSTWIPVTCTASEGGKAKFDDLEPGILWQALAMQGDHFTAVSVPFISQSDGTCIFLHPKTTQQQTLHIDRKYPIPEWLVPFRHRSVGGRFEGANKPDFSDATLLYTTVDSLDMRWHKATITSPKTFRYLRYYAAFDSHCNIAEIRFLSSGRLLKGEIIGTEGSSNHTVGMSKVSVFDGVDETFYDSEGPDDTWAGLALVQPERVTDIEFIFRTDDNYVRSGDEYELLYFTDHGPVSLGRQTGDSTLMLHYDNVPEGALYWLRNLTRGREERPFTMEEGEQRFW